MKSLSELSIIEFKAALTPERLRIGMIIQAAIVAGALFFFSIILYINSMHRLIKPDVNNLEILTTMTMIELCFFVVSIIAGSIVYRFCFTPAKLETAYNQYLLGGKNNPIPATPAEKAISLIRTAMLIRTACIEGTAFFGLAVLLIAAQSNLLSTYTWLWLNTIPLASLVFLVVMTFPTSYKLEQIFETSILKM